MPDPLPTDTAWFVAGTKVMTLRGEVPIEQVHTGDRALTLSGNGSTLKPIAALRSLAIDLDRHSHPDQAAPIRIAAGAIEPGMPIRDLHVSPGLAISLEDAGARILVPAFHLVNGATITRAPMTGQVTYWQLALAEHDILMADGMAAESAVAAVAEPTARVVPLRRPDRNPNLLPGARATPSCAPIAFGADSAPLHARLLAAAQAQGHRLDPDPALTLSADGVTLPHTVLGPGHIEATLPPGTTTLLLLSRTACPADIDPRGGDIRHFGIPLASILLDGELLSLESAACAEGFLPLEGDGASRWRWTTGRSRLALPPHPHAARLELSFHADWAQYWVAPDPGDAAAGAG